MNVYYIDWSEKDNNQGWGCSDNKTHFACIGFQADENAKYNNARYKKKYTYTNKLLDLKLYAFFVAEHVKIISKEKNVKYVLFIICQDRSGHFNEIIEFTLDFLDKQNIILLKKSFAEGTTKGTLAHDLALAFTRRDYRNIPICTIIKDYKFQAFDSAIPKKKKNY